LKQGQYHSRVAVVTQDGSFHCVREEIVLWTLEESVTKTSAFLMIDLPTANRATADFDELGPDSRLHQSDSFPVRFMNRWKKHIGDFLVDLELM
jgi:hypothetical protein